LELIHDHGRKQMTNSLKSMFLAFAKDESGQDLIEYALVAALIALGAIAAMTGLSGKIGSAFNAVGDNLSSSV
jgi:pilus assembly protein Flp/PilA